MGFNIFLTIGLIILSILIFMIFMDIDLLPSNLLDLLISWLYIDFLFDCIYGIIKIIINIQND